MTRKLKPEEKKRRKEDRRKSKQQKPASKTVKTITQPKPADQEAQSVNLCDDCAYEFGECEGKPKFASDQDETLTGADADRVIECPAFLNVAEMPTVDQARKEAAAPGPAAAEEKFPGLVIVCSGGCGKTTKGMTYETMSGEFKETEEGQVPEWTCQDCLDKAAWPRSLTEEPEATVDQIIRADLPERPDPKRFQAEEDFGTCPSCEEPLKRTALNRYQDAIRCTNPRCRAYRAIVKTIPTGVK